MLQRFVRMRPFQYLDHPCLMDILSYVTQRYTKMFSGDVANNDFLACRELLILLQTEVEERKKQNKHHYPPPGLSQDNTSI